MLDTLIIGGGAAGLSCALVLGSGLKKPFAEGKKVSIITHQKTSHLQNALFNNTPDHIITLLHACLIKRRFYKLKLIKKAN